MWDDSTPVQTARVSYNGDFKVYSEEKNQALLDRLIKDQHLGVLEHITFSFIIECSIPIARQIMRYRTFSYNELSRRYLDGEHTPFEFEVPEIRWNKETYPELTREQKDRYHEIIWNHYNNSINLYNELLDMWIAKETSRYLIPQGMKTRFYMTWNLRNFLHFINQRTDIHAQKEIRDVAFEIKRLITEKVPKVMSSVEKYK